MDNGPDSRVVSESEYVVRRFRDIPKEMIEYLWLDGDDDAKASLEVAFRFEYFRRRHGVLEKLLLMAYRKYRAAEMALSAYTDDPSGEIAAKLEDCESLSGITEVPTEF